MGSRDYRNRERKKPKKEAKKALVTKVLVEVPDVEQVPRAGRRAPEREEKE